ncbi:MAG: rhodanese-like domain-containing protein [Syntrophobacterales bacterium]|jgi:rhodanese-related sulfurtransferase
MKSPKVSFLMKIVTPVILLVLGWEFFWWALGVRPLMPWSLKGPLQKSPEEFTLVDVRTALEYELFHIPGSKNQPNLLLHPELFKAQDPRKPLVIICMTGHRSSVVAYGLRKRGFTEVHNLTFGMLGWLLSGGETGREKEE